jgi:hypothetical protein
VEVSTQIGPFSIVPEWVLLRDLSATGLKLYVVLARFADWQTGEAFPARETLAERMGCSEKTVDRAVRELEEAECIRSWSIGRYSSKRYQVFQVDPRGVSEVREGTDLSSEGTFLSREGTNLSKREDTDVHLTRTNEQEPIERKPKNKRALTFFPDDWKPNESFYSEERFAVLDIDDEFDSFKNWCLAKGVKNRDWDAAFRNWLKKGLAFRAKSEYRDVERDRQKRELDEWIASLPEEEK